MKWCPFGGHVRFEDQWPGLRAAGALGSADEVQASRDRRKNKTLRSTGGAG